MSTKVIHIPANEAEQLLKHFPQGILGVDVETTGLSPLMDKIVELAAVKLTPQGEVLSFQSLVNPGRPIPALNTAIHHITDEMVKDSPTMAQLWEEFSTFCAGLPIVAHNAKFDVGFLAFEAHNAKVPLGQGLVYCSCKLSKNAYPSAPNHKLGDLSKSLGIALENHHRAWDDALAGLRLFAQSLEVLGAKGERGLKDAYLFSLKDFLQRESAGWNISKDPGVAKIAQEVIEKLRGPIATQEVVEIRYAGGSHKGQMRPVRPISVLPLPNGDMLYAQCMFSNHFKYFALNKVKEVRVLSSLEQQKWQRPVPSAKTNEDSDLS